jgi:hypothetical protein
MMALWEAVELNDGWCIMTTIRSTQFRVIAGLDPAIHLSRRWTRGSSPRVTMYEV